MALGAQRKEVLGLIVKRGMTLAAVGLLIGMCASAVLSWLIRGLLFEVSPNDVVVVAEVSGLLLVVALGACLIPARRAASIDPLQSLRAD